MKGKFALALALTVLLSGCSGGNQPSQNQPPVEPPPAVSVPDPEVPKPRLEVPLRLCTAAPAWPDNELILELPQVVDGDNEVIRTFNARSEELFEELTAGFAEDEWFWAELLSWPTETDRYLNAVTTFCLYPNYVSYGEVSSWVYDKQTGQEVSLEEALAMANTTEEALLADFADWSENQGREMEVSCIDSLAFRMLPDGRPQFLAGVTLEAPDLGDAWTSFHSWTEGEIRWNGLVPFDPDEVTGTFADGPLTCQQRHSVAFDLTMETLGVFPTDCTLETLQFTGHADSELDEANESLRIDTESQRARYLEALTMTEEERFFNGASWGSQLAYPVTQGRYLNAVTVQAEHMCYRVEGDRTWNLVSSIVYDSEENRIIPIEEALALAGVEHGDIERAVWEYVKQRGLGTYENWSSLDFLMLEDGTPMFMLGAIVYREGEPTAWPTFFTWTNGRVEWTDEHPVPLYMVDMDWEGMACQKTLGQYDEEELLISEEEAAGFLRDIEEVQRCLDQGMTLVFDGTSVRINGTLCRCASLGTDHDNHFVAEIHYAIAPYEAYRMNPLTGQWEPAAFG